MCPPAFAPALGHSLQHPPEGEGSLDELWDTLTTGLWQCPSLGRGSPGRAQPQHTQGKVHPVIMRLQVAEVTKKHTSNPALVLL